MKSILHDVLALPVEIEMFSQLTPDIREEKRDAFEFFIRVFGRIRGKDLAFRLMGILNENLAVGVRPMTDAIVGTGKGRKKKTKEKPNTTKKRGVEETVQVLVVEEGREEVKVV